MPSIVRANVGTCIRDARRRSAQNAANRLFTTPNDYSNIARSRARSAHAKAERDVSTHSLCAKTAESSSCRKIGDTTLSALGHVRLLGKTTEQRRNVLKNTSWRCLVGSRSVQNAAVSSIRDTMLRRAERNVVKRLRGEYKENGILCQPPSAMNQLARNADGAEEHSWLLRTSPRGYSVHSHVVTQHTKSDTPNCGERGRRTTGLTNPSTLKKYSNATDTSVTCADVVLTSRRGQVICIRRLTMSFRLPEAAHIHGTMSGVHVFGATVPRQTALYVGSIDILTLVGGASKAGAPRRETTPAPFCVSAGVLT